MALEIHSVRSPGLNYNSPWRARSLRGLALGGLTSSSVIRRIQNFLRDQRGMAQDVGAPDGDLGPKTYNAITRVLGRGWNSLEENAIRSQVESALAPWPLGAYPPPAAVEAVQRALNLSPIDGKLGPGTWDALTRRLGEEWTMLSWHGSHSIVSLLDRGGRAADVPAHDDTETFGPAVIVQTDPTMTPGKSSVVATQTMEMQQPSDAEAVRIRELQVQSTEARAKQYEQRAKTSPKWRQRAKEARKLAEDSKADLATAKERAERTRRARIAKTKARDAAEKKERERAGKGRGKKAHEERMARKREVAKNGGGAIPADDTGGEVTNGRGEITNGRGEITNGRGGITKAGMGPWGVVALAAAALLAFFGGGSRKSATAGVRLGRWKQVP